MGEVQVRALRGVDLEFHGGEFSVLLGPSGSGKSTLLNILGGLDIPTSGRVLYRDQELSKAVDSELTQFRRSHVGFVFQFYNLIPSLTARENVALVTEISPNAMPPEETLRLVDLADRMDHYPNELSGGQQQRVASARALVTDPTLIVADEPTGDLDRATGEEVLALMDELHRDLGKTIVMVTHDPKAAARASRMIHLEKGVLVSDPAEAH